MGLHGHVVEGAEPGGLVAGFRLRLALGAAGRRWAGRAGRLAVGVRGHSLLQRLLYQRLQVHRRERRRGRGGRWGRRAALPPLALGWVLPSRVPARG